MEVKPEEIRALLEYFSKNTYKARDPHPKVQQVMERCLGLFGLDYTYSVIPNTCGELSTNYPSNLVILESEKGEEEIEVIGEGSLNGVGHEVRDFSPPKGTSNNGLDLLLESSESCISSSLTLNGSLNGGVGIPNQNSISISRSSSNNNENGTLDPSKLKELCSRARFARCRARFPVPVILYNKKHICRSATLSGGPEIYGRSSFDYFFSGGTESKQYNDPEPVDEEIVVPETQSDWQLFDRVRSQDIRLLKSFQVQTIVDLMVEKKKVKFGVNVTSSEKVDKENRYADFNLISLPYPGCEFFKDYRDKGYNAEDLVFEWNQGHVDANIFVPYDPTTASLNTDWSQYRNWDLVTLTQKYLKLLLAYLRDGNKGLLVHCISGWDRTPLFVSLLRLSLWADGVIHKSLSAEQILYLTIAYDWLLFGHNLEDRLSKGEEILFFCFYFLKYIVDSEFCIEDRCEVPLPKPQPQQLTRVRNDSDIHLDGVLLDRDGSQTSPEGSNWSLNSCGSSLSNKSQDNNPPTYFQVVQDSWEDCNGSQHLLNRQRHVSNNHHPLAQNHNYNVCSNSNNGLSSNHSNGITPRIVEPGEPLGGCVCRTASASSISSSINNGIGLPMRHPAANGNGLNGHANSSLTLSSCTRPSPNLSMSSTSSLSSSSNEIVGNKSSHPGRTSPVAVPVPNRTNHQHRPESTSSASIGSWQLITGTGSLRETISTSDPGSSSSHSHPLRLPVNGGIECIEGSESSCTLVEDLTPVDCPSDRASLFVQTSNGSNSKESGLTESGWKMFDREDADVGALLKDDSVFSPSRLISGLEGTPVNVTPTKEGNISRRRERLQTVRAHFYTLYASAIGFQFRSFNDNGGSGGLGFLIGNFATKVGIRSANRTTNV